MSERNNGFVGSFSDAMKALRQAMGGISQEKLARAMDVSMRTVSRYEDGSYPPTPDKLLILTNLALSAHRVDLAEAFQRTFYKGLAGQSAAIVSEISEMKQKIEALGTDAHKLLSLPLESWWIDEVPMPAVPRHLSDRQIALQIDAMSSICEKIMDSDDRQALRAAAEMLMTVLNDMRGALDLPDGE